MSQERRLIFKEELVKLADAKLITDGEFEKVSTAYDTFYLNLKESGQSDPTRTESQLNLHPIHHPEQQMQSPQPQYRPYHVWSQSHQVQQQQAQQRTQPHQPPYKKAPTPRPERSPQEIRDRNIIWVLVIGVIFVLLSGLILATSSWNALGSITKTVLITLVAIIFFGISMFTEKTLKIKKTAFAFWVLGGLYLPVAILSAGFFRLLGDWLSVFGEGKYLLGVIGALICFPVYLKSTLKYGNRLFAWITLITASIGVSFAIAAFYPPIDVFYFGLIVYNALLVYGYSKHKLLNKYELFSRELPLFIQANLVISTLLTAIFFENPAMYGFNMILTALVYLFVTFSRKRTEYSYVFGVLIVYGIYQLVENSPLVSVDFILFALTGFIFSGMERYLKDPTKLKKIFSFLSGLVSLCSFLFIGIKGVALNDNKTSLLIFIAFLIIAVNYVYLAYHTKYKAFAFSAPLFILASGSQSYALISKLTGEYSYPLHMFVVSAGIFFALYYMNKWKYTKPVALSSGTISIAFMAISGLYALVERQYVIAGVLLIIYGAILYLVYEKVSSKILKNITRGAIPFVLWIGYMSFFDGISSLFSLRGVYWYQLEEHIALGAVLLFGSSLLFRKIKSDLDMPFFWWSHIFIPISVLIIFNKHTDKPLIFVIPLLIYVYSTFRFMYKFDGKFRLELELPIRGFLYAAFITGTMTLFSFTRAFFLSDLDRYVLFASSVVICGLWFISKEAFRRRIAWYLVPASLLGVSILAQMGTLDIVPFVVSVIYISMILFVLHVSKVQIFGIIPLVLLSFCINDFSWNVFSQNDHSQLFFFVGAFFVLKLTGELLYSKLCLYEKREKKIISTDIDWYSVFSLSMLLNAISQLWHDDPLWLKIAPYLLLTYFIYSQRKRVKGDLARNVVSTLWMMSLMIPYLILTDNLPIPSVLLTELNILPWIALTIVLSYKVWHEYGRTMKNVQFAVLLFAAAALFKDILLYGDIIDALILGVLSLVSVISGMQFKIKSYFFVGAGSLLLNVMIQTQELWGNIPWWGYLLIAGLILIGFATITELQKGDKEKKATLSKQAILDKFKDWR